MGEGVIENISDQQVSIKIKLLDDPPPKAQLTLIASICRPQTMKKIISLATMIGAQKLILSKTDGVDKSYLSSKELRPEIYELQILKALEQAGDTVKPEVEIWKHFSEQSLREQKGGKWFGDTITSENSSRESFALPLTICVGCEVGWSERERTILINAGYIPVSLGPRILRVDIALALLAGRVLQ